MPPDAYDDALSELRTSAGPTIGRRRTPRAPVTPTRSDRTVFQPEGVDWSVSRSPEIESYYQGATGSPLPIRNRGQGAIHNRLGFDHRNSLDVGLAPGSRGGQALESYLRQNNIPFLAFSRAIPGVATGPHYHIGRPSSKTGGTYAPGTTLDQSPNDQTANLQSGGDEYDEALNELRSIPAQTARVTSTIREADSGVDVAPQTAPSSAPPIKFTPAAGQFSKAGYAKGDTPLSVNPVENIYNALTSTEPAGSIREEFEQGRFKPPASLEAGYRVKLRSDKNLTHLTSDDVELAYVKSLGPEYEKLNERHRQETGQNLVKFPREQLSKVQQDDDGSFHVSPSAATIGYLNAYAQGGLPAAQAEYASQIAEINKNLKPAQEGAKQDIAEIEAARKSEGAESAAGRVITGPTERFAAGIGKTAGGLASIGGLLPNQFSDYMNRKARITEYGASLPPLTPEGKEIQKGLPEKVGTALVDLGFTVFEIAVLKKVSGLSTAQVMASEQFLKTSDEPAAKRIEAVAKAYALGAVLDQHVGRLTSAAIFGVPAGVEGAQQVAQGNKDPYDVLLDVGIQGGMGAILGGGGRTEKPTELAIEQAQIARPVQIEQAADELPEILRPRTRAEQPYSPPPQTRTDYSESTLKPSRVRPEGQPNVRGSRGRSVEESPQILQRRPDADAYDRALTELRTRSGQESLAPLTREAAQPTKTSSPEEPVLAGRESANLPTRPTRSFRAGANQAGITFESESHRDLYDAGARLRASMRDQGTRGASFSPTKDPAIPELAKRLGISEQDAIGRALDTHRDVREQMSGVKDGETRQVKDRIANPARGAFKPLAEGRESLAVTDRGSEIQTRYALAEAKDLITSHDSALNPNRRFPIELQPRERDRAASAEQVNRIAGQLRPEFLGESPKASEGAPIIGPDGIVESGNGRVLALNQAYRQNNEGAKAYRDFLQQNAERFGLDPDAIEQAREPVLVRVRTSEVDRAQFVREANEQSVASLSSLETARSDARKLTGPLMSSFRPTDSGEIITAANRDFIRTFMRDVVGPNEIGRYATGEGQLSQEGIARIRNAVFARAYGDSPEGLAALEKLAESPDNNIRNITTAMLTQAPRIAAYKEGVAKGTRFPLDISDDISAAAKKISALRDSGQPVTDYLAQHKLFGDDMTPLQRRLLQAFDENKRNPRAINGLIDNYLRGAEAVSDPRQAGMFAGETPSKESLLEAALLEAFDEQANLFNSPNQNQGVQTESATRGSLSAADSPIQTTRGARQDAAATAPAYPGEGRPLTRTETPRLSSLIDRLKAQETEARNRLNERAGEIEHIITANRGEAGVSSIPADLVDIVTIGASKLAQKTLTLAQFIDEMAREFGDSIRNDAQRIYRLSQQMLAQNKRDLREEQIANEVSDRIFSEMLPRDVQREALRIAQQFRTTTDTQGKFIAGFKSRVAVMAQSYGEAGGELTNRLHLGDIKRGQLMDAGNTFLSKVQDVYGKVKNDFERQRISNSVIQALEDRTNARRYLDTPEKQTVYDNTVRMLDAFRAKLTEMGYKTRENYFTHLREVDVLEQILDSVEDAKSANLNEMIAAKSKFLKPRYDADIEIRKDLPRVLFTYLKSVSKEIAYSDAVEYYYDRFTDDIPPQLRRNSMERAIKLMQNSLQPEKGRGRFYRAATAIRNQQYRNFLAYNLKASAQNFTQTDFARLRWTKEANRLVGKMWRNRNELTGPIDDAIKLATTHETPLQRFLEQYRADDESPGRSKGRIGEFVERTDPFGKSEKRNWGMSELGSIINSVVKRPEYAELKKTLGEREAINKMLERQDVFDAAVREAATTAAETQVAANPAMRGEFYDVPLHRIIGMFTAFKMRQMQVLGEALGRQEGFDGARAQAILRRGLSREVKPVEVLREIQTNREALETMSKRARKFNEDVGVSYRELDGIVEHLRTQERELNTIIKEIEPLAGSKPRAIAKTAKYFAKVGAISVFFNLMWETTYSHLYGEDEKDKEERLSTALNRAFWDVLPTPFYGYDPGNFLASPAVPRLSRSAPFGKVTRRGLTRDFASYGTSVIPFAGIIDRAANRRLSGKVVDAIAPKKTQ